MQDITSKDILDWQKGYQKKPLLFNEQILGGELWEKEREILESVRDNKETAVRSCHASGKTYTAARVVLWWLCSHIDSIVITTAPTFRQVKEILWREIRGAIANAKQPIIDAKHVLDVQIKVDEQWFALGLSTDKPDQFQGFHSPHLLVVVDEASGVVPEIYEAIDGLAYSRLLMIGNPLSNEGRFAASFKKKNVSKIHISAFDTPNIKAEGDLIVIPGLITKEDIERISVYYGKDSDVYRVRILGEFPLQDSDALISVDSVARAMEREVEEQLRFEKMMGVDVARFGDDRTAIVIRLMNKVLEKHVFSSLDTMEIAGRVMNIAKEAEVKPQNINIDEGAMGPGVIDRLNEQGWPVSGVNFGSKADDPDNYLNLRAELYAVKVKEWLKTGSLPKDDDWYELASVRYKFNSSGKLQLERKEDMKKRGIDSPDVADAFALTFAEGDAYATVKASEPVKPYYGDREINF